MFYASVAALSIAICGVLLRLSSLSRKTPAVFGPLWECETMLRHAAALTALSLTALLSLSGCGDSPNLISADKVSEFKPGTTTQTEVVAALGKPIHTIQEADGTKIDQYPASEGSKSGSGFMPDWLGGTSTGGAYNMISFEYSPGGILKDIHGGGK